HNSLETFKATEELIKKGRKRIAFLCGKDIGNTKDRIRGYKNALHNYAIPFQKDNVIDADYQDTTENIDNELKEVFQKLRAINNMPNAIVGGTDTLSIKNLEIIADLDFRVSDDVVVICFTDTNLATYLNHALSTIRHRPQQIAKLALELLNRLIEKQQGRREMEYA